MNEREDLWTACLNNPDEFTARGALADKLEEDGHGALAKCLRTFHGRQLIIAAAGRDQNSDYVTELHRSSDPKGFADQIIRDEVSQITESAQFPAQLRRGSWSFEELDLETIDFDERGACVRVAFTITNGSGRDLCGRALARFETDGVVLEVSDITQP